MQDPIYRAHCTTREGEVIVYDTLSQKVAREMLYTFAQSGHTNIGLKVVKL